MDIDTLKLCMEADLLAALKPLAGEPRDALTRLDAEIRIAAVLNKYVKDAVQFTDRPLVRQGDVAMVFLTIDPAFSEAMRRLRLNPDEWWLYARD